MTTFGIVFVGALLICLVLVIAASCLDEQTSKGIARIFGHCLFAGVLGLGFMFVCAFSVWLFTDKEEPHVPKGTITEANPTIQATPAVETSQVDTVAVESTQGGEQIIVSPVALTTFPRYRRTRSIYANGIQVYQDAQGQTVILGNMRIYQGARGQTIVIGNMIIDQTAGEQTILSRD